MPSNDREPHNDAAQSQVGNEDHSTLQPSEKKGTERTKQHGPHMEADLARGDYSQPDITRGRGSSDDDPYDKTSTEETSAVIHAHKQQTAGQGAKHEPAGFKSEETEDSSAKVTSTNRNKEDLYHTNAAASDLVSARPSREDAEHFSEPPEETRPEIDDIMGQFKDQQGQEPNGETASPSGSNLPVFQYPPRSSSLAHLQPAGSSETSPKKQDFGPVSPSFSSADPEKASLSRTSTVSQPPLPAPDPEPDLPFDFHRFLEQLRSRSADPVAKFLRSFLQEFGKKQWMVHEQVKIISDFLSFISNRMVLCDVWRTVSEAEFDNAREGMEKLVMNRLYSQTFSPEISPTEPMKSRKKGANLPLGPGRKGQHQEDVERDDVLAQKVRIYSWVREEHLDIKPFGDKGKRFLTLAQQGMSNTSKLSKMTSYRAPRDKVICVLNTCKVLFGYLRHVHTQQSADDFIPLLIYTVIKANPAHLVSNVQYILRFRNQDKLNGEAGYYMSSLMGAVQFIENLDRTSLTISPEEFEANVERAVSVIAERDEREGKRPSTSASTTHLPFTEKAAPSRPEVTPRHSLEGEQVSPRKSKSSDAARGSTYQGGGGNGSTEDSDDSDAVSGLIRSIQKPFSSIGKIFSDDEDERQAQQAGDQQTQTQQSVGMPARITPLQQAHSQAASAQRPQSARYTQAAQEHAARQASVQDAEIHKAQRAEHQTVVETLSGMFPDLDKDVISDVVRMKDAKVGLAVDACLALSR